MQTRWSPTPIRTSSQPRPYPLPANVAVCRLDRDDGVLVRPAQSCQGHWHQQGCGSRKNPTAGGAIGGAGEIGGREVRNGGADLIRSGRPFDGARVAGRFIRGSTISHSFASASRTGTRLAGLEITAFSEVGARGRVSERQVTSKRNGIAAPANVSGSARRACNPGSAIIEKLLNGSSCGTLGCVVTLGAGYLRPYPNPLILHCATSYSSPSIPSSIGRVQPDKKRVFGP